jgi:hypothetical protein
MTRQPSQRRARATTDSGGTRLTDFDQVAIGIADVGAEFGWVLDRIGQKVRTSGGPFPLQA